MKQFARWLCMASLLAGAASIAGEKRLLVAPGDILTKQQPLGGWSTVKILLVDTWPDGSKAAHVLTYEDSAAKPDAALVAKLGVRVWHAPIDAASFGDWERIANAPATEAEMQGFRVYLKMTDFPRYLEFTHQDAGKLVAAANEHYRRGIALGDAKQRKEAIAEYDKAIDLFPLFYEAIDNRAFLFMELGDYRTALAGFEDSLRVEPNGESAVFSRAECHLRLDEFEIAERLFGEGAKRFPARGEFFEKYRDLAHRRINPAKQR